jgi:hypothetical protein
LYYYKGVYQSDYVTSNQHSLKVFAKYNSLYQCLVIIGIKPMDIISVYYLIVSSVFNLSQGSYYIMQTTLVIALLFDNYSIPRTNVHRGYFNYGLVVVPPPRLDLYRGCSTRCKCWWILLRCWQPHKVKQRMESPVHIVTSQLHCCPKVSPRSRGWVWCWECSWWTGHSDSDDEVIL